MTAYGMNRRKFLYTTGLAAGGSALALSRAIGATKAEAPFQIKSSKKLRLGVLCPAHCAIPFIYADVAGLYKEHGIATELVYVPGMPDLLYGIISGKLHCGHIIVAEFLAAHIGIDRFQGNSTRMVAPQVTGTNGGVLSIAKGNDIKTIADLKGKVIGVHSQLMTHNVLIRLLLEKNGLTPGKDVEIRTLDFRGILSAMQKGEIDAFTHPEPLGTIAKAREIADDFMLTKNLWFRHPCCVMGMTEDFFKKEPDTVRALTLGTTKAALVANDYRKRDEVMDTVHSKSEAYGKIPREIFRKAFMPGRTDFDPFPYQSSAQVLLGEMRKQDMLPDACNIESVAKETFLSNYCRDVMKELGATNIPVSNGRTETLFGEDIVI